MVRLAGIQGYKVNEIFSRVGVLRHRVAEFLEILHGFAGQAAVDQVPLRQYHEPIEERPDFRTWLVDCDNDCAAIGCQLLERLDKIKTTLSAKSCITSSRNSTEGLHSNLTPRLVLRFSPPEQPFRVLFPILVDTQSVSPSSRMTF